VCENERVASVVLNAISSVLSYNASTVEFTRFFESFSMVLNVLTSSCYTELFLVGEDFLLLNSKNVRLTSQLTDTRMLYNSTFMLPKNAFEEVNNIGTSTVHIKNMSSINNNNNTNFIGMSIYQVNNNPNKVNSNSSVLTMQYKSIPFSNITKLNNVKNNDNNVKNYVHYSGSFSNLENEIKNDNNDVFLNIKNKKKKVCIAQ